jgi:hypothetical protein
MIMEHEVKLYRPLTHTFYTSDNDDSSTSLLSCSVMISFLVKDDYHDSGSRRSSFVNTGSILPQTFSSFLVLSHLERLLNTPQEM